MKAPKLPRYTDVRSALWRRLGLVLLLSQPFASFCQGSSTVVAWGANNAQQTVVPPGLANVTAVAGGDAHSLALKTDGTVVGWGYNINGQATPPPDVTNVVAIAAGNSYSMALKRNGTVRVWGLQAAPPPGLTNVMAIAAGHSHCLALKEDGVVVAWGDNSSGQTNVPSGLSDVVAIAAGDKDSLALKSDGTIVAWGDDAFGKIDVPPGLNNAIAIAAGQDHCLALTSDGNVVAWGADYDGQSDVPPGLSDVVAISAGAVHSLALRSDGTLAAWGDNSYNQSVVNPAQNGYFGIAAGGYHNLGLRSFVGLPIILSQPASQNVGTFSTVTFQVVVVGTPPLAFQWQKNGTNLVGATMQTLVLSNIQTNDTGTYQVVVSNAFGVVTSQGAVLTASPSAPAIAKQPQSQTIFCGEGASFQVTAKGSLPISYQWQFQGAAIADSTSSILALDAVTTNQAGAYSVVLTNAYGALTSAVATLTVVLEPPFITSSLTASGKQGQPFDYTITALHQPTGFDAAFLPAGLTVNPTNGEISGVPQTSGTFGPTIMASNACATDSQTLLLTIAPSAPTITSPLAAGGSQGTPFNYTIQASESPTWFGAQNLPAALTVDADTGLISGIPAQPGDFESTILASNAWGLATATLHLSFAAAQVTNLSIANITYNYSSPYLLDFQFSLRDSDDPTMGNPVVVDPATLVVNGFEDDQMVSTNETSVLIRRGNARIVKAYLVLDFTESVASLANGDANSNGVSDAVDFMVSGAQDFVNHQPSTTQIGVYEFHREDQSPSNVVTLTTDKVLLNKAIAGIPTNYVHGFSAGSRCWDALVAAIKDLGSSNRDEQHFLVFVSDGRDESSIKTTNDVINAATNAHVSIYCIGFGADLDTNALQTITSATSGRYYTAATAAGLGDQFAQISKDFNGQFILRWATLKRSGLPFMPSFTVTYSGLTATSPPNPWYVDTNNPIIDTNSTPPTTNYNNITNFIIGPYTNRNYTGDVTVGSLRLSPNADVHPNGLTLRATYVPRYIRQIRFHYRANWPCITTLQSTNSGELLAGWSFVETNDSTGGKWALLSSPNPEDQTSSLRFADFGSLLNFNFRDALPSSNGVFSLFDVDNTLYTNTGKQSFAFDTTNLSSYVTAYTPLPFGTPVPWLIAHGFPNNWVNAETNDPDADGMLTWQEYQANTDPRDAKSKFIIRGVTKGTDGRNQINFSTAVNRNYRVDSSTDLVNWQTVQDGIAGTGADLTVVDTQLQLGSPQLFYRVKVF